MAFGYILIGTKNSYEHEVAEKLSMLDEVFDVEPLVVEETALADPFFKDYDLIAKVKINGSISKIESKIKEIRGLEKIKVLSKIKK